MKLKLKNLETLKMEKGSSFDEPHIMKKILLSFGMFILYYPNLM